MDPLNAAQTVFTLFYAIMWGALANVWPRWKAFDLSLVAYPGNRAVQRWLLSFGLLNAVPIAFFVLILFRLQYWRLDPCWWPTTGKLLVVMLQPFALIGFYWVWASILARFRNVFYPATIKKFRYPGLCEETDLDSKRALPNFLFGLLYIFVPLAAFGLVSWRWCL